MKNATREICINAIGIALFVVLTMCVQVPVFENYYICLGYVVMALYCYIFGPINGTVVGCAGTIIYCLLTGGINGMPGWALGNFVIGVMFGISCKITNNMKKQFIRNIILAAVIVISTAIGILIVKSLVEVVLYAHPFWIRVLKNMYAFVADVIILIISLPVCSYLKLSIQKYIKL